CAAHADRPRMRPVYAGGQAPRPCARALSPPPKKVPRTAAGAGRLPSAAISTFKNMMVNELSDGVEIDQVLLVREVERRPRGDGGGEYLRLALGDRTGSVVCMVWEELDDVVELARAGEPVHVSGRYTVHPRFGPQINLRGLAPALDGSY